MTNSQNQGKIMTTILENILILIRHQNLLKRNEELKCIYDKKMLTFAAFT